MTKTLFTFGHGFSAAALARLLAPRGWRLFGTTRNPAKFAALQAAGVRCTLRRFPDEAGETLPPL